MPTLFSDADDIQAPAFSTRYGAILEKMQHVNPVLYAKTRNYIDGAVTRLSPYLSRGVISLPQVLEAMLKKGYRIAEMEKFLQELCWREYFQRVWQARGDLIWEDLKQLQPGAAHHQMITALQNAATGIQEIDEQIKSLYTSGYMHNHVRMYVASIACNIAKAHWLQPSKWLYYHLLDGDIASNNCSWQWVSGAFAAKKYYCNQENINRYTHSQQLQTFLDKSYDELPCIPVPELLKATATLHLQTTLPVTDLPLVDTTKPTLLYNGYNLDPLWRKGENVNRVLLLEPSHFSKYPVSQKVMSFMLDLANNIPGIQVYSGEPAALQSLYKQALQDEKEFFISKEHPAFTHYPGAKDSRDWLFPEVNGYYPSFFSYWKKCEKKLLQYR